MKTRTATIVMSVMSAYVISMLTGCATYRMPDGSYRQGLTPAGQALVQLGVSTAIGAGTGAIMKKSPSWATGAVSGATGNIGAQIVNNFAAPRGGVQVMNQPQINPAAIMQQQQNQMRQVQYSDAQYVQQQPSQPQYAGVTYNNPPIQQFGVQVPTYQPQPQAYYAKNNYGQFVQVNPQTTGGAIYVNQNGRFVQVR